MTGEPGKAVEGGWAFTNTDGTFKLVYKADEMGFQPEAEHIPVPVEDTNEVTEAKATFYSLFDAHKAKVEAAVAEDAAAVVDARRKREVKDVFRYEDEETGSSHYMTGEPGKAVEGGWAFTNTDGTFKLVYKADEMGFQPEAEHIPVPVEDTNEVTEAKATFYSLFDAHKAKVEAAIAEDAAAVVDARRKREAHRPGFKFHPYHGFVPVGAKDDTEEVKEFKFLPYHGFVPADETVEGEEKLLKNLHPYHKKMTDKRFKLDPYHGFVPILEEEPELKFHPYYGFVPAEEDEEVKEFKFLPYHGYIPADETVEGEEELLKKLHPYHQKLAEKRFKLHPYHGFVPIMKMETGDEDTAAVVTARKKRDTDEVEKNQDLILPPPPHPYNFHPFLGLVPGAVKPEDSENKLYKYVPYYGFVPLEADEEDAEETDEEEEKEEEIVKYKYDPLYGFVKADQEIKPLEEQEYKYTPYVGFVPVTGDEEEDVKTYKFNPFYGFVEKNDENAEETTMEEQKYKFVPFYGFVPVNEDGEVEETAKAYGNLEYTFHPYFGYLPTPVQKNDEEQLYKLDPIVGFVPIETDDEDQETELDAKRKKRDAQVLLTHPIYQPIYQPVYQPAYQPLYVPVVPQGQVIQTGKTAETDETTDEEGETKPAAVTFIPTGTPLFANQLLVNPFIRFTNPVLPGYPVIPNDPDDAKQGAVEF